MKLTKQTNFPRRNVQVLMVPAETAIRRAINAVENIGADTKLTEAVNLLQKAKDLVSDFIDENVIEK